MTLELATVLIVSGVVGTGLGLVAMAVTLRKMKQVEVEQTSPVWAADRLVAELRSGPGRAMKLSASIVFRGHRASAQWHVDVQQPAGGFWLVRVGEHSSPASDTGVVRAILLGRFRAIVNAEVEATN